MSDNKFKECFECAHRHEHNICNECDSGELFEASGVALSFSDESTEDFDFMRNIDEMDENFYE